MTLTTVPTDAVLGAEVTDIDLDGPIDADTAEEIRTALCEHGVLVFRGQEISPEAQVTLTRQLGVPEVHVLSKYSLPGIPEVFIMWDNRVTMHRALSNYGAGDVRYLLRTSVMGEAPVWRSARYRLANSSH